MILDALAAMKLLIEGVETVDQGIKAWQSIQNAVKANPEDVTQATVDQLKADNDALYDQAAGTVVEQPPE